MICSYSLSNLQAVFKELNEITNCSSSKGTLSSIVKKRRDYLKSCKKIDLLEDLKKAIDKYYDGANYEKIYAERQRNDEKRLAFQKKIIEQCKRIF